jgi:hypothetical protein
MRSVANVVIHSIAKASSTMAGPQKNRSRREAERPGGPPSSSVQSSSAQSSSGRSNASSAQDSVKTTSTSAKTVISAQYDGPQDSKKKPAEQIIGIKNLENMGLSMWRGHLGVSGHPHRHHLVLFLINTFTPLLEGIEISMRRVARSHVFLKLAFLSLSCDHAQVLCTRSMIILPFPTPSYHLHIHQSPSCIYTSHLFSHSTIPIQSQCVSKRLHLHNQQGSCMEIG